MTLVQTDEFHILYVFQGESTLLLFDRKVAELDFGRVYINLKQSIRQKYNKDISLANHYIYNRYRPLSTVQPISDLSLKIAKGTVLYVVKK